MPSTELLTEISENVTLYHRSKYPMKVGDVVKPKKDEDGKHWLEHVPAEIALELMRRKDFSNKPSRFNCVYSSVIPRSRFVDKGTLYVVKPRGKMLVTNSALIDEIHENFDRRSHDMFGFDSYEEIRKLMKDNPEHLLNALDYWDAKRYWEGSGKVRKEDVEVLSDEAVIVEVVDETGKRLAEDKVYVVQEDDTLLFTFQAFAPWKPGTTKSEPTPEWIALYHKIINHIFSSTEKQSEYSEWEKTGYLRKGLKIMFTKVQSGATKGGDEARDPESIEHLGKYRSLEIAFEMDGKWYRSHGEDKSFQFSLSAKSFMKRYHKQPWDYGKHLKEGLIEEIYDHLVIGFTSPDEVISSEGIYTHDQLARVGAAVNKWRYDKRDKIVYWWDEPDEMGKDDVEEHLRKKYGYGVKNHKQIVAGSPVLEEAFDPTKVIVGAILNDSSIIAKSNIGTHEELLRLFGKSQFDVIYQWRYNKREQSVYWWDKVSEDNKADVEWYLKRKFGVEVEHNKLVTGDDAWKNWDLAHGKIDYDAAGNPINEAVGGSVIVEGVKELAAMDFIKQSIKGTEWEGKVFLAGGAVRDELRGESPKDLDLLVNKPNGGIDFANWITTKINAHTEGNPVTFPRFGTAKFNLRGITHNGIDISDMDIEAVMPRKEQYTAGSRKPDVSAGELKDDVERRDFTVNSLLKDLSTGEILDLTGMGKADIKAGIVRTPLSPDKIFTDDPLRMLRAVRFAMKYGWKLPMFMMRGLKKNASQLQNISQERIRDELNKMLVTGSPDRAIKLMKVTGLLQYVIPELKQAVGMTQNVHHTKTVFGHTLDVLSKTQPVLIQRLMALFHDIGKTVTKSVTPTGVHFYGHEAEGAKIVKEVMERLKYPNELIKPVMLGVANHMRLKSGGDDSIKLSDKALRKFKLEMGDELENVLSVIHADNTSHSDNSNMPNQINNVRERLNALNINVKKPNLPINGNDLKEIGIKPGPIYSKLLGLITDAWLENPNLSKDEAMKIVNLNLK